MAFVRLLHEHLIPEHGPQALRLLMDEAGVQPDRFDQLLELLLEAGAVPLAPTGGGKLQFGPRKSPDGAPHPVVVAVADWQPDKISSTLAALCPAELDQVHPSVPGEVLARLASDEMPGWEVTHVTYDEYDVLRHLQPARWTPYFPWPTREAHQAALVDPEVASLCLDVVLDYIQHQTIDSAEMEQLRTHVHLPDNRGLARPLCELFTSHDLPPAIAPLGMPALLHPRLVAHQLFSRRAWKLCRYTLETFFEKVDLQTQPEPTRRGLWQWLSKNWQHVPAKAWRRIAQAPVAG